MQILGSIGSKGACLRMREIVTPRRLLEFDYRNIGNKFRPTQEAPADHWPPNSASQQLQITPSLSTRVLLDFSTRSDSGETDIWPFMINPA